MTLLGFEPKCRKRDHWCTPRGLFEQLDEEFHFTLDACATADNALCERFYTEADDGLLQDWTDETVFINPPYQKDLLPLWIHKAIAEVEKGATVVALVPVRSDVDWWHDCLDYEIRFIRGRLRFGGAQWNSPTPSALIVFRPGVEEAVRA